MVNIQGDNKIIMGGKRDSKGKGLRAALDLDGCIAFWEKSAAKTCGVDYDDKKIRQQIKDGKRMETFVGGDSKMWPMIDKEGEEWWEDMEKLPWADELVTLLQKESKDFIFLSSPSNSPLCYSGKIKWVLKNYPKLSKNLMLGCKKHMFAGPNTLLVDDTDKKIKQFREYGGHAFKWPCPLSIIDKDIKIEDVLQDLKDYIKEIK
jgi:5'(3')-deoxyribonucleotidase